MELRAGYDLRVIGCPRRGADGWGERRDGGEIRERDGEKNKRRRKL